MRANPWRAAKSLALPTLGDRVAFLLLDRQGTEIRALAVQLYWVGHRGLKATSRQVGIWQPPSPVLSGLGSVRPRSTTVSSRRF